MLKGVGNFCSTVVSKTMGVFRGPVKLIKLLTTIATWFGGLAWWQMLIVIILAILAIIATKAAGKSLVKHIASILAKCAGWSVFQLLKIGWKIIKMIFSFVIDVIKHAVSAIKDRYSKRAEKAAEVEALMGEIEKDIDDLRRDMIKGEKVVEPLVNVPDTDKASKTEEKKLELDVAAALKDVRQELGITSGAKRGRDDGGDEAKEQTSKKSRSFVPISSADPYINFRITEDDKRRHTEDELRRKAASVPTIFLTDLGLEKYAPTKPTGRITLLGEQKPNRVTYDSSSLMNL